MVLSPLWISLKISTVAGLLTASLGVTVAYAMAQYHGKRKSLIDGLLLLPLVLPPTVIGFVLLQLLSRRGVLGAMLHRLQLSLVFTWQGGVVAAVIVTFPLVYRTALAAFEQIDPHILAAARSLGASEWRVFRTVALPLAQRGIVAGTLLAWARGLGEFGATLMVAGNIPGRTATLPLAIYTAVETGDTAEAWRWSGVILSLALSAIAGINLWTSPRQSCYRSNSSPVYPSSFTLHPSPCTPALTVNLHHALPDFDLKINFTAQPGAIAILGASGAGKSMLLRLLAGLEQPDWGQIRLNDQLLWDSDRRLSQPSRSRRVGIVFQNYALFPHLTVAANIAFGLPQGCSQREKSQRISALLAQVHLPGIAHRYPHQLSGGQQQRVALVRALASEPDLLLLDEPFSALDPHLCQALEQELATVLRHYRGITLLVTHRQDLAYRLCPRWLVVEQGQLVADGRRETLWQQPRSLALAKLLGCENITPVEQLNSKTLHLSNWNYDLQLPESPNFPITHVGLRANTLGQCLLPHLLPNQPDVLRCWLTRRDRTPEQIILWLKFHHPPQNAQDFDAQAVLSPHQWQQWQDYPWPWFISLKPSDYLLLSDSF